MSKKQKITRRVQRQEKQLQLQKKRVVKRRLTIWISTIIGVVVVVVAAVIIGNMLNNRNVQANNNTSSSKNAAIASDNPAYPVVDDIACQANEQLAYHIHAHLSIYINGQSVTLPANIGIASDKSCIYWLHTHRTDGVIHIESPNANKYSLGTFFKLWEDYFSSLGYPSQLNTTNGWQVYVNGKPYNGDFHSLQLDAHELITLAYNSPSVTPDTTYSWGTL